LQSYEISEMNLCPHPLVGEDKHSTEFLNDSLKTEVKKAIKPQDFFPLLGYQILQLNCEEKLLFTVKNFACT